MAAEARADPCRPGTGPITADGASTAGATGVFDGVDSGEGDLQAATKAATALDTRAASQNRRGPALASSCVVVFIFGIFLIQNKCATPHFA